MTRKLLLVILAFALPSLACGALDSAVEQVEEVAPTLEAAAATVEAGPLEADEELAGADQSSQDNELCSILTSDDIRAALEVSEVTLNAQTVGPDQASCSYTLDSNRVLFVRVDLTTPARSARTIYDSGYAADFGDGPGVEEIQGPWTDGFWNEAEMGVYAVRDDEVAFRISYPPGDGSDRDGLVQLTELFFERLP